MPQVEMNIPVTSEKFKQKGRLILRGQEDFAYVAFGPPSLLSKELKSANTKWNATTFGIDYVGTIEEKKGIFKKYTIYISIEGEYGNSFEASKEDAEAFTNALSEILRTISAKKADEAERIENINRASSRLDTLISVKMKATSKIDLENYARQISREAIPLLKLVKPDYFEEREESGICETDVLIRYIRERVEEEINKGELSGIINELGEYIDRDFIVREQRIVQVNVQMDFNSLIHQLGNKGIMLSSIQCPQCKAACTLPKVGSSFSCESCGSLIRVNDLFEKFKGILG